MDQSLRPGNIVSVYRFRAIWYKAAGNEPLSIVMVKDPGCKYPDTVFFDTDTTASDKDTIQRRNGPRKLDSDIGDCLKTHICLAIN